MDKKRCTNFPADEVELLLCFVEEHKEVIECKKTDAISSTAKENEWRKIEGKFNAACGTGRTAKMLRSKWDSLKKWTKKEYAQQKQSLYRTGGGPSREVKLTGVGNRVLALLGLGATGTVSVFDSDFVSEEHNVDVNSADAAVVQNVDILEFHEIPADTPMDQNGDIGETASCSWNSWNPQQLRQPKCKVLQVASSTTINSSATPDGGVCSYLKEKEVPESSMETSLLTPKCVQNATTKRKRFYKTEPTSAKLQKQRTGTVYEELAKKKIEYIDFQMKLLKEEAERKEKRLAEKHKLEIKILEVELKNKENCQ